MDGIRRSITSTDGARIGMLTAGSGPALLLVHGGMGRIERWAPIWELLTRRWTVTAIDRRGRGSSSDGNEPYRITAEYQDVTAVAQVLAEEQAAPVDVFGHSYGATCILGAAANDAPFGRLALYEPPGPETVSTQWIERVTSYIKADQPGRAMFSFLTEIIGLSDTQVEQLRRSAGTGDLLEIVAATMPREGKALTSIDLYSLAKATPYPTLIIRGANSPAWAKAISDQLATRIPQSETAVLPGQGHEAIDTAPHLIEATLRHFLQNSASTRLS